MAFPSHRGIFIFKRMPFGLKTASAKFQRAIDVILATVRFQCALTYLDDIVIYSPIFEQHLLDLAAVLTLLRNSGASLKNANSAFAASRVKCLGVNVEAQGVEVDCSMPDAIWEAQEPRTKTSLRRFLGKNGFYRKFIAQHAKIAAPLKKFLKEDI